MPDLRQGIDFHPRTGCHSQGERLLDFWNRGDHVLSWSLKFRAGVIIWGLKFRGSKCTYLGADILIRRYYLGSDISMSLKT